MLFKPTLFWLKNTGKPSSNMMRKAVKMKIGDSRTKIKKLNSLRTIIEF